MFFSIPSSSDEIITVTPIGAKAILSVFFENKNGRIFNYGGQLDTVSISIDGKQIARQLPVAPFATTTPFGAGRFDWEKVALAVNLNVDNSEIKISGSFNNQFNIVFVCSDEPLQSETGFDYVETKRFVLKDALTASEVKGKILAALAADFAGIKAACVAASTDDVVVPIFDYDEPTYTQIAKGVTKEDVENLNVSEYLTYAAWEAAELDAREAQIAGICTRIHIESRIKTELTPSEVRTAVLSYLSTNFDAILAELSGLESGDVVIPVFYQTAFNGLVRHTCGVTKGDAYTVGSAVSLLNIGGNYNDYNDYAAWFNGEHLDDATSGRSVLLQALSERISNVSKLNPAADMFGTQHNIVLDSAPERVVAYSFITPITDDVNVPIELNKINLQADLNISDSEDLPLGFDLNLISILPRVPYADAVHAYSGKQATNKYGQLTLHIAGNQRLLDASNDQSVADWQLYLMFIYKKIA